MYAYSVTGWCFFPWVLSFSAGLFLSQQCDALYQSKMQAFIAPRISQQGFSLSWHTMCQGIQNQLLLCVTQQGKSRAMGCLNMIICSLQTGHFTHGTRQLTKGYSNQLVCFFSLCTHSWPLELKLRSSRSQGLDSFQSHHYEVMVAGCRPSCV